MIFGDEVGWNQLQTITREEWLREREEADRTDHVVLHDVHVAGWDQ